MATNALHPNSTHFLSVSGQVDTIFLSAGKFNWNKKFQLMGVIEICNTSSICIGRTKPSCLIEANQRRRITCMASSVSVQDESQQKQCVTGDNFIRQHLRKLSPYQPILPFEVEVRGKVCVHLTLPRPHLWDYTGAKPSCLIEANERRRITYMASSVPVQAECVTGDAFIRQHLRKLSPYQPILTFEVLSTRLGRKPEDIVKLDANENPYGPPPEVNEALGSMKFPYIYPDPESRTLRAALAEDSGLEAEYILAGCGADELIDLIMRCILDPGDKIVDCPPTFTMYEFDAAVNGAHVIKAPRNPDFSLDVERIAEVVEHEKPKCIFLTSPNNPDGSIIDDETLLKILRLPILVILDEAYVEFSGMESKMKWVKKHENLIVLRTFSKRAGLAGLRVGYGAFPKSIIEFLWRAKQPYNVSVAAEVAACAALKNPIYLENVKVALVQERERLFNLLKEVPFLDPYPSYSNFILCKVMSGMDAKKLKEDLATMGVMIRHYNSKELKGYVRVSVGKPEHTEALMKCLKHFY